MRREPSEEARRWFRQAENDLDFAELAWQNGFFAQCCFICQQAAEKAVKGLIYSQGARQVLGHSVLHLLYRLTEKYPQLEQLYDVAKELDQYYIPTRYPNGLPDGAPFEFYTQAQAEAALRGARRLLEAILAAGEGEDETESLAS